MPKKKTTLFINKAATWVYTDISHYANRDHIIEYMESIYPTTKDKHNMKTQNYMVETYPTGDHRIWAATALSEEVKKTLIDMNNHGKAYN